MKQDFPYQSGYLGELDAFSPRIRDDLERLVQQLKPSLAGSVTKQRIAWFRGDRRFRQIIAVEERDGQPAIVGTANVSFLHHSYDADGHVTEVKTLWLGSFVVDGTVRGKGIAARLWNKILEIGVEEQLHLLQFTSSPSREAAHNFYAKMGAHPLTPALSVKHLASSPASKSSKRFHLFKSVEQNFELATGLVALVFSEAGTTRISEEAAQENIAEIGAERFEQLIPTSSMDEASTVLFSVSY